MGNARQHNRERKARKFARGLSCAADLGLSRECLSFVDALPGEQKLRLLTHLTAVDTAAGPDEPDLARM